MENTQTGNPGEAGHTGAGIMLLGMAQLTPFPLLPFSCIRIACSFSIKGFVVTIVGITAGIYANVYEYPTIRCLSCLNAKLRRNSEGELYMS
jgi:hypothetical protein